jgi:hypothetical protein
MSKRGSGRRMAVLASAALLCAGLALLMSTGPAAAKVKNPLVGSYRGTTEEGTSVTFRITKKGKVVDFAGVVNICPGSGQTATATTPGPIPLTNPVPGYPKGKRFDYFGPAGSPPGATSFIKGKVTTGTNFQGKVDIGHVPTSLGICGSGKVPYSARKVG